MGGLDGDGSADAVTAGSAVARATGLGAAFMRGGAVGRGVAADWAATTGLVGAAPELAGAARLAIAVCGSGEGEWRCGA